MGEGWCVFLCVWEWQMVGEVRCWCYLASCSASTFWIGSLVHSVCTWMVCALFKTKRGTETDKRKTEQKAVNRWALGLIQPCGNRSSFALLIKKNGADMKSGRYQNRTIKKGCKWLQSCGLKGWAIKQRDRNTEAVYPAQHTFLCTKTRPANRNDWLHENPLCSYQEKKHSAACLLHKLSPWLFIMESASSKATVTVLCFLWWRVDSR